jgi:hypothetical protein
MILELDNKVLSDLCVIGVKTFTAPLTTKLFLLGIIPQTTLIY